MFWTRRLKDRHDIALADHENKEKETHRVMFEKIGELGQIIKEICPHKNITLKDGDIVAIDTREYLKVCTVCGRRLDVCSLREKQEYEKQKEIDAAVDTLKKHGLEVHYRAKGE